MTYYQPSEERQTSGVAQLIEQYQNLNTPTIINECFRPYFTGRVFWRRG